MSSSERQKAIEQETAPILRREAAEATVEIGIHAVEAAKVDVVNRQLKRVPPDQERAILAMTARGEKLARIARITGLSRPTIYRVLRNQEHQAATA